MSIFKNFLVRIEAPLCVPLDKVATECVLGPLAEMPLVSVNVRSQRTDHRLVERSPCNLSRTIEVDGPLWHGHEGIVTEGEEGGDVR